MIIFLLWREYVSWPALHQKVVELQSRIDISFVSRILCWVVYSFFYVAMVSMSWSRLEQQPSQWGYTGYLGLFIQLSGLVLETTADFQKNEFKSRMRNSWCNVGVWSWSTHPNYLGEGMFWFGSYLAHGFNSIFHSILATVGLAFITVVLRGSTRSLALKQLEKYGKNPEFCEFYRTHGVWGPKHLWWWLNALEQRSKSQSGSISEIDENGVSSTNIADPEVMAEDASPEGAQPLS